jgi:hypothetical protein
MNGKPFGDRCAMAALLVQSQGVVPTGEIPSPPQLPPTNDSARLSQRNKLPLPQQGELELNGLCSRSGESRQYHGVDHVNDPVPSAEICQNNPGFAPNIVSEHTGLLPQKSPVAHPDQRRFNHCG